jgi:hypothetical protein
VAATTVLTTSCSQLSSPSDEESPSTGVATGTEAGSDGSGSEDGAGAEAEQGPGTVCGSLGDWEVVVAQGEVDCETAIATVTGFEGDGSDRPTEPADVEGWACKPIVFDPDAAADDAAAYSSWCSRGEGTTTPFAVMTVEAGTVLPEGSPIVDPDGQKVEDPYDGFEEWAFTDEAEHWSCGVAFVDMSAGLDETGGSLCYLRDLEASLPGTEVAIEGDTGEANAVRQSWGQPAEPAEIGEELADPDHQSTALPNGSVMYAAGAVVGVDEDGVLTVSQGEFSYTASEKDGFQKG